ncbi:MAG: PPC domain-containing protein [Pseudomonadota bacterium]
MPGACHFRMVARRMAATGVVLLLGAAGAAAQSCAEAGWIGGDEATANLSTAVAPIEQALEVDGTSRSFVRFRVDGDADVRLEAAGQDGADPVAELVALDGRLISEDDDSGGNLASRIETTIGEGTYCLTVRGYYDDQMMTDIRIGLQSQEAMTVGGSGGSYGTSVCTAETAAAELVDGTLDAALSTSGQITTGGTADGAPFHRFRLEAPTQLSITAENENADPVLTLYDEQGSVLAENDDFDGLNSRLDFVEALPAGTYCIGLTALSDSQQRIELTVAAFDEAQFLQSAYARGEMSPPPGSDYPVDDLGPLATTLSNDFVLTGSARWIRFEVSEPSLVLINALGSASGMDTRLALFTEAGRRLDENDDFGGGFDSRLVTPVDPGVYMIALTTVGGSGTAGAARLIVERYIRAPG